MYGIYENTVPWGSTTTKEYLIEDWVYEETAEDNNLSYEAFDELPTEEQLTMVNEYIKRMESYYAY